MDTYRYKQDLSKKYEHLSRNDLLWIIALNTFQKATFTGPLRDYITQHNANTPVVKQLIKDAGSGEKAIVDLDFKYIRDAEGSEAALYESRIYGEKVMLKLTKGDKVVIEGVIYEALVLKYFFDYMLNARLTPNLPIYYGSYINTNCYLFTEFMDGNELLVYLELLSQKGPISVEIWRSILFQILYTLLCFQRLNIRHNDLHLKNVFIDPDVTGDVKYYTDATTYYTVPLTNIGLIKIFDMDFAAVDCLASDIPAVQRLYRDFNKEINRVFDRRGINCDNHSLNTTTFKDLGIKNKGNTLFDTFVILCTMLTGSTRLMDGYKKDMDDETLAFIGRIFSNDDLDTSKHDFHCRTPKVNRVASYAQLKDILNDEYFLPYRNSPTNTPNIYRLPLNNFADFIGNILGEI